jgi:hypothetical protein
MTLSLPITMILIGVVGAFKPEMSFFAVVILALAGIVILAFNLWPRLVAFWRNIKPFNRRNSVDQRAGKVDGALRIGPRRRELPQRGDRARTP